MRIIIQRVTCQVCVNGEIVGKIGKGLKLLIGIANTDTAAEIEWMVRKCLELRLFGSEKGANRWQKSIQEIGGEILVISFTLYDHRRQGRRPSFDAAAASELAEDL